MVLKPEPIFNAVEALITDPGQKATYYSYCVHKESDSRKKKRKNLRRKKILVFICGHYEGYDERIREHLVTDEISIGDFVLTGGEFAAMTVIDSVVRLITKCVRKC